MMNLLLQTGDNFAMICSTFFFGRQSWQTADLVNINHVHFLLKAFLNAHSGFNRDDLQGYLNLFSFILNPPTDHLEKVAKIFDLGFENPKTLRYRDLFGLDKGE